MLNIDQLNTVIDSGIQYFWKSTRYLVIKDKLGRLLVQDKYNGYCTGLQPSDLEDVFC